jgi:aryl-alcohol dehydrogenase-like predicted oxidoreductase
MVSELAMGGLFVSSMGAEREEGIGAIRRALELGITYVDTAPGYRNSEEIVGSALDSVHSPCIVSTKLGGRPQPFDPRDKKKLRQSVEESLRLLHRDHIDIIMIHEPDRPGQYDWFTDWERFHGPVTELLGELKTEGIISYSGIGGTTAFTLPLIIATGEYDVVLTAFNYSILWQEALISVLPEARKQQMGIVVGSPLQQGALARPYEEEVEHGARWLSPPRRAQFKRLYAFTKETGIPLAELALRFVISNPDISTTLTGARSVAEVEQNVSAVEKGPLSQDILDEITEIASMVPFRPYEEPFGLPFGKAYRGPGHASHGHV